MYFMFLAYHICATINIHPAGGGADYGENGVFHENPRFCVCFAMLYTYILFGATSCPQSCHSNSHVQVDGLPLLCVCAGVLMCVLICVELCTDLCIGMCVDMCADV